MRPLRLYTLLTKETHPDRGGDAEEFKRVQAAYEMALGVVAAA